MNTHFFSILALVLALRVHLAAEVYFLDSVDGRDTRTGIREDHPGRSPLHETRRDRPADYLPTNRKLISDAGIEISPLPGDAVGLRIGLKPTSDILGNPIRGLPDPGAIELP